MENKKNTLKKNKDLLVALSSCKPKIRKAILQNADKDLIDAICQCVFNLLDGNINLSNTEKIKLSQYKRKLRKIIEKSNFKTKKKILIQKGGFLQFLIPAAITGISEIISSLISKN
jgi:hypothetical protein